MEPVAPAQRESGVEFDRIVAELEDHFAQHGSYPQSVSLESTLYDYSTDGEDFELSYTGSTRKLRYSSSEGYLADKETRVESKAWSLERESHGWGPWQQFSYRPLEEFQEQMPDLCDADLRFQLRAEAVPSWVGELDPRYRHFEVRVEFAKRQLELQAFRAPESAQAPPALAALPDRPFAMVGEADFLARLGVKAASPKEALVFSRTLDEESVCRLQDFLAHGERYAGGKVAHDEPSQGNLWAQGRFRFQDRDGQLWDCHWTAGKEPQHDWVRLSWEAFDPSVEADIPTRSCDYEDDFSRRRTVASHRYENFGSDL